MPSLPERWPVNENLRLGDLPGRLRQICLTLLHDTIDGDMLSHLTIVYRKILPIRSKDAGATRLGARWEEYLLCD